MPPQAPRTWIEEGGRYEYRYAAFLNRNDSEPELDSHTDVNASEHASRQDGQTCTIQNDAHERCMAPPRGAPKEGGTPNGQSQSYVQGHAMQGRTYRYRTGTIHNSVLPRMSRRLLTPPPRHPPPCRRGSSDPGKTKRHPRNGTNCKREEGGGRTEERGKQ